MRSLPLLVALPMIVLAFAGCSSAAATAPAQSGLQAAKMRALDFDSTAQLTGVAGMEIGDVKPIQDALNSIPPEQAQEAEAARAVIPSADPQPGDGKAPAWAYTFVGSKGLFGIVVDARGQVTFARQVGSANSANQAPALGDWAVDSDKAAAIVAAKDAGFAAFASSTQAVVMYQISVQGGKMAWEIEGGASLKDAGRGVHFVVDATTGAILQDTGVVPPVTKLLRELGSDEGRLMWPTDASTEATFKVGKDGHNTMKMVLQRLDTVTIAGSLSADVTAPDGKTYHLQTDGVVDILASGTDSETASLPAVGDWKVQVQLSQGPQVDWKFYWCTDGNPVGGEGDNPACQN